MTLSLLAFINVQTVLHPLESQLGVAVSLEFIWLNIYFSCHLTKTRESSKLHNS